VSDLGRPVLDWLAPRQGERILDLGCGDGALTLEIAAAGAHPVGLDADPDMVAAARARGLETRLGNGHELGFDAEFDAVFSNAALHWMKGPEQVLGGVARALKPGGRFVGEFGGAGNVDRIRRALQDGLNRRGLDGRPFDPWYFPTVEEFRLRLEQAGFQIGNIALIERPTPLGAGMRAWLETFAQSFTRQLPMAERAAYLDEVTAAVAPQLRRPDGTWWADYVRLRFSARLP